MAISEEQHQKILNKMDSYIHALGEGDTLKELQTLTGVKTNEEAPKTVEETSSLSNIKEKSMENSQLFDYTPEGIAQAEEYLNGQSEYLELNDLTAEYAQTSPQLVEQTLKKDANILENTVADLSNELVRQTATAETIDNKMADTEQRINNNDNQLLEQIMKQNEELMRRLTELQNRSVLQHLGQDTKTAVSKGIDVMKEGVKHVSDAVKTGMEKAGGFFKNAFNAIKESAKEAVEKGLSMVGKAIGFMRDRVDDVKRGCSEATKEVKVKCLQAREKILDVKDAWHDYRYEKNNEKMLEHLAKKAENVERKAELDARIADVRSH